MIRGWRKGAAAIGALILLIVIGIGVLCAVDQNPDMGENKGVVSGFDPLAEPGEDVAKEKGIIPAHALAIANIVSEKPLGEKYKNYTDYRVIDARKEGYYRIQKEEPGHLSIGPPEIGINSQTGGVIRIAEFFGM